MARRPVVWVAWVAAVFVAVEAVVLVAVAALLSRVVDAQHMSLAGIKPSAMTLGAWVGCGIGALFSLVCAFVLARTARADRGPGRAGRVLLIVAAVVHGLLGAVTSSVLGWGVFAVLMVGLGLLVWVLLSYGPPRPEAARAAGAPDSGAGIPHQSGPEVREGPSHLVEKPAE
ncbi:hypothetical protein AB0910_27690 [Streptomyces sp. NPDC047002]|uniref:hypothetical protein n=1 Tax=Streptomyces sp. NPDC047002 TaxID=3155475 RepID=UPI003451C2D5